MVQALITPKLKAKHKANIHLVTDCAALSWYCDWQLQLNMKLFEEKNIFHRTHLTTPRGGSLDRDLDGFPLDQMEVNQRGFHHHPDHHHHHLS